MNVKLIVVNGAWHLGRKRGEKILRRASKHADIILGVEFKYVNAKRVLGPEWHVAQSRATQAQAGSVVAVRKSIPELKINRARLALGTMPRGVKMLPRFWTRLNVKIAGQKLSLIAGHMPPKRYDHLWHPMAENLRGLLKETKRPEIVGGDWNVMPFVVRRKFTGYDFRGHRLIGALLHRKLKHKFVKTVDVGSDHLAVVLLIQL